MAETDSDSIVARPSPRTDLLVFEIRAKISEPDISWMGGRIEKAFDTLDQVDLLLIMTDFEGADLGAALDGEAMRASARSIKHVRRYGVVGAPAWARALITVFNVVSPVDAKTFDLADEAAAWEWISRPESD